MKNIAEHIESLLSKHDCIIVPSLGGFIAYNDHAWIKNSTLHAPSKHVRFNGLLSYHDGLLAEAIMKERGVSYSSALLIIKQEVETLKLSAQSSQNVTFGALGTFFYDNDTICFSESNSNFLPDNFALPTVKLVNIIHHKQSKEGKKSIIINLPTNTATNNRILKYAASIAVIIFLTFFTTPIGNHQYKANLLFDSINQPMTTSQKTNKNCEPETNKNCEPLANQNNYQLDKSELSANQTRESKDEQNNYPVSIINYKFNIIVASLTNQASAEEYIAQQPNPQQLRIIQKGNKFRISQRGFNDYNEALNYLNEIKPTQNAWILVKK